MFNLCLTVDSHDRKDYNKIKSKKKGGGFLLLKKHVYKNKLKLSDRLETEKEELSEYTEEQEIADIIYGLTELQINQYLLYRRRRDTTWR